MYKLHKKKIVIRGKNRSSIDEIFAERVKYGLRNRSEFARAAFAVKKYRSIAYASPSIQQSAIKKLKSLGILHGDKSVLDITVSDFLDARLQTIVSKKLAISPRDARSRIVRGDVTVRGRIVRYPSYISKLADRPYIRCRGDDSCERESE